MIATLALASALALAPGLGISIACPEPAGGGGDEAMQELYQSGRSYVDFLGRAARRTELWHGNTEKAKGIDMALVSRARSIGGSWRFLAVAIDSCSDSVSTIPYLAQLVSMVAGLDMRVVDPTSGRAIMEAHRTADGRPSTPTVLLLNDEFDEVGCFIERPPKLKLWVLEHGSTLSSADFFEQKMSWYAEDAGQDTLEAFVAMLEAAATGSTICH